MKRNTALNILNPILGLLFLNQVITGLLADSIPPDTFEVLHVGGGIAFAVAAVLHVVLNWSWVKANFLKKAPKAEP